MSRPRSTDPSVALSIAVPQSLKTRLDQELSYKQSRSRWVVSAIKAKLQARELRHQAIDEMSSEKMLFELFYRNAIDEDTYLILKKQVVETATKQ